MTLILAPALIEITVSRLVPVSVTAVAVPALAVTGAMLVSTGRILNVNGVVVPPGVVRVMLFGPAGIVEAITRVALIEFTVTTGAPASVMPAGRFSVASMKPVPTRVTGTDEAAEPSAGVMLVSTGTGALTVKVTATLVPPGVVAVMFCAPRGASTAIATVAAIWPKATTGGPDSDMPRGRFKVAPTRPEPVRVTGTDAPLKPVSGAMPVRTGSGSVIVKVTALLAPPELVTVMLCAPSGELFRVVKVAVI